VGVAPIAPGLMTLYAAGVTLQQKLFEAPSLFWAFGASDIVLQASLVAGVAVAGVGLLTPYRFLRSWTGALLGTCLMIYLSWMTHGQAFMQFQWDALLLESAWLTLCLSGVSVLAHWRSDGRWASLAARFVLFKLIFLSGWVKWQGGDALWSNHTALLYHFETQPLPTVVGVWFHSLPEPILKLFSRGVVALELFLPILFFFPRRIRMLAFVLNVGLQGVFALTGNFAFFNLLAVLLGLYLIDDRTWSEIHAFLTRGRRRFDVLPPVGERWTFRTSVVRAFALIWVLMIALPIFLSRGGTMKTGVEEVAEFAQKLHISHPYGLFARMTQVRYELVFEGSVDRKEWREYLPRFRPGALDQAPRWVAPFHPRFDWQAWFAVLGQYENPENRWVGILLKRLLDAQPEVLQLFSVNPFQESAPRFVRASIYRYRLQSGDARAQNGNWWSREWLGQYSPELVAAPIQQ